MMLAFLLCFNIGAFTEATHIGNADIMPLRNNIMYMFTDVCAVVKHETPKSCVYEHF